jgi:outer membrane lipoprotein carrier protein
LLGLAVTFALLLGAAGAAAEPPKPAQPAAPAAAPAEPDASEIADRVQAFYDRAQSFSSPFEQRYCIEAHNECKDSKGRVVFQKKRTAKDAKGQPVVNPARMAWRYDQSDNQVVAIGKKVQVYEQSGNNLYEQVMENNQHGAALGFMTGEGRLKRDFKLRKLDARALKFEGGYVLEALPAAPNAAYSRLLLFIDAQTSQVRRVILIDAQNNKNRFTFTAPVVNPAVTDADFVLKLPPGKKPTVVKQ